MTRARFFNGALEHRPATKEGRARRAAGVAAGPTQVGDPRRAPWVWVAGLPGGCSCSWLPNQLLARLPLGHSPTHLAAYGTMSHLRVASFLQCMPHAIRAACLAPACRRPRQARCLGLGFKFSYSSGLGAPPRLLFACVASERSELRGCV